MGLIIPVISVKTINVMAYNGVFNLFVATEVIIKMFNRVHVWVLGRPVKFFLIRLSKLIISEHCLQGHCHSETEKDPLKLM